MKIKYDFTVVKEKKFYQVACGSAYTPLIVTQCSTKAKAIKDLEKFISEAQDALDELAL